MPLLSHSEKNEWHVKRIYIYSDRMMRSFFLLSIHGFPFRFAVVRREKNDCIYYAISIGIASIWYTNISFNRIFSSLKLFLLLTWAKWCIQQYIIPIFSAVLIRIHFFRKMLRNIFYWMNFIEYLIKRKHFCISFLLSITVTYTCDTCIVIWQWHSRKILSSINRKCYRTCICFWSR